QILIKIISSEDEETRDKITKATNWQNPIQPATLRATDRIQRLIEENLKGVGLYYDRRKNYYKNLGKPADRIISIPLMAQAVMSIILAKPDSARARPSSLIKEQEVYSSIFSEDYPIKLYTNSALLLRIVDIGLKELLAFDARDRANVRFYVLYWIAVTITGKLLPRPNDIATMNLTIISPELLESALRYVRETYLNLGGGDQLAKGTLLKLTLEIALRENGAS
ncbi:MAG TPA: AIPR family protein, partial [Asticcacaulis sp.]|nr:AIPR family protein [Asticcacaulis sp.]